MRAQLKKKVSLGGPRSVHESEEGNSPKLLPGIQKRPVTRNQSSVYRNGRGQHPSKLPRATGTQKGVNSNPTVRHAQRGKKFQSWDRNPKSSQKRPSRELRGIEKGRAFATARENCPLEEKEGVERKVPYSAGGNEAQQPDCEGDSRKPRGNKKENNPRKKSNFLVLHPREKKRMHQEGPRLQVGRRKDKKSAGGRKKVLKEKVRPRIPKKRSAEFSVANARGGSNKEKVKRRGKTSRSGGGIEKGFAGGLE